jgi:hypothetical protein
MQQLSLQKFNWRSRGIFNIRTWLVSPCWIRNSDWHAAFNSTTLSDWQHSCSESIFWTCFSFVVFVVMRCHIEFLPIRYFNFLFGSWCYRAVIITSSTTIVITTGQDHFLTLGSKSWAIRHCTCSPYRKTTSCSPFSWGTHNCSTSYQKHVTIFWSSPTRYHLVTPPTNIQRLWQNRRSRSAWAKSAAIRFWTPTHWIYRVLW